MRIFLAALWTAATLFGQTGAGPAGHWEGAIQAPNGDLNVEIDLAQEPGAGWIGTFSAPAQGAKGIGLIDITVKGSAVSFGIKAPGDPRFQGTVAEGGKMSGELTQGGMSMPFQLTRTGEAKIEKQAKNAPLSKELEGTWEGVLDTPNQQLRLRFVFSNQDGAGTGTIFSLDQDNAEIPMGRITQTEARVKLEVPMVGGGFEGELKGAKLTGEWSQGGGTLPLTLTKPAK
jgi:hypothetical protein